MPRERQTCTRCSMRRQRCDRNAPCQRCIRAGAAESCTRVWSGGYDARIHRRYPTAQLPTNPAGKEKRAPNLPPILLYSQLDPEQKKSLGRILPPFQSIVQLIDYHGNSLLWYHGSLSARHFRSEFEQAWDPKHGLVIDSLDLQWSGLLFATMAASLVCAPAEISNSWNFRSDRRLELASKWYRAALACIKLGMRLAGPNVRSVQAIQILFMSAGKLGFMKVQIELFHISQQIAQALGFCKVPYKATLDVLASLKDSRPDADTEVVHPFAQQIWTQLCMQHWLAIMAVEMLRKDALTSKSKEPQIASLSQAFKGDFTTTAGFRACLEQAAVAICDSFGHDYAKLDMTMKYESVLRLDMRLRTIDTIQKDLSLVCRDSNESSQPKTRALRLIYAHLMLVTHHEFFVKSFEDPRFMYSRWASVTASKDIIREMEEARSEHGELSHWNYLSTIFAALVTLSLNITSLDVVDAAYTEHRELIDRAILILRQSCYFKLICNFPTNINEC